VGIERVPKFAFGVLSVSIGGMECLVAKLADCCERICEANNAKRPCRHASSLA
jgi:hypothetical protein